MEKSKIKNQKSKIIGNWKLVIENFIDGGAIYG